MKQKVAIKKIVDAKRLRKLLEKEGVSKGLGISGLELYQSGTRVFEFGSISNETTSMVLDAAELSWEIRYSPCLDSTGEALLGSLMKFYLHQGLKTFSLARETLHTYKEIHSIFQIAEAISKARFLAEVSQRVLESFQSSLECPWISLWLYKRNGKKVRVLKFQEIFEEKPIFEEDDEKHLMEHLLNNVTRADIFSAPHPDFFPVAQREAGDHLFIPLRTADRYLGGILATGKLGREYDSGALKLAISMGIQASFSIQNSLLFEEIESLFDGVVRAMIAAIDERDSTTSGHSARIALFSERFAEAINRTDSGKFKDFQFSPQEIRELRYSGLLHDIGKIGVREDVLKKRDRLHPAELQAILSRFDFIALKEGISMDRDRECVMRSNAAYNLPQEDFQLLEIIRQKNYEDLRGEEKPYLSESEFDCLSISHGNLTPSEIQEMRRHPYGTYKILSKIQFSSDLKNIPKIASEHHEKIDGSGYPHGLKGEEIMLQSQIMGISDIYEALVDKKRPYKPGFSRDEALSIIEREVQEEKIDPVLFEIFKANLDAIVGKST